MFPPFLGVVRDMTCLMTCAEVVRLVVFSITVTVMDSELHLNGWMSSMSKRHAWFTLDEWKGAETTFDLR
jgi:hypothetical protein